MMEPKSRFSMGAHEHAAQFVRESIRNGRWQPGQTLQVAPLATELGVSASPVREALARLHGERLLETRHRDGYSIPLLQPYELEGEYRFISMLAQSLAAHVCEPSISHRTSTDSYVERFNAVLLAMTRASDLPAAAIVLHQSVLRLSSYIRAEPRLIATAEQDLVEIEHLIDAGDGQALREVIKRHFVDCIAAVPILGRHVFEHSKRFEIAFE